MSQVPDKVLSWLYSVLHEYQDPQRTYSDAARVLSALPSLSPRTEVYTYESGSSALLLTVSGTLPVDFRGATYRFPIKLWVPQSYPQESPIVYVTPGRDMLVRPGQHVGVEGRVYHPYLSDWSGMWDRANIADFLNYLQQAFAREPPLVSKAQQQQLQRPAGYQQHLAQQTPGAPPQLPPKHVQGSHTPVEMPSADTPPPRPPKPGDEGISRGLSRTYATDGPPLPPLPGKHPQNALYAHDGNGYGTAAPRPHQPSVFSDVYQKGQTARQQSPLPALPHHVQQEQQRLAHDISPVSPVSPAHTGSKIPGNRYSQPPPLPMQSQSQVHQTYPQGPPPPQQHHYSQQQMAPQQQPLTFLPSQGQPQIQHQYNPQNQQFVPPQAQQPPPQQKKQPPPDLLSDPFDVALPSNSGPAVPAPPIPPNPEKEHLLQAISSSMVQQVQQKVAQNRSAVAPLQAQQNALRAAHARLEAEIAQLEALDATLSSNESILHRSIQDCNHTISEAKSKKQPPIDEVLVAPTLVAQQLWTLTAEEAACREAMYVLQKAVDRGRISGSDFVRQMRGLGRESFLKMVLARKCARGLGLDVDR
ncbi:hypothetical protein Q7P37_004137 [Cladosporium fusiforme]